MKISVELSDTELGDIRKYTGERKKGPAIRKMLVDSLMMKRRRELLGKFASGEWSVDLPSIEELRRDRDIWK
jgi:hypothetical protein